MNNPYFSYPDRTLWERESWADREPVMQPLLVWMGNYNEEHLSPRLSTGRFDSRTDGFYNPKSEANLYPEFETECAALNMRFRCDEIGGAKWIAVMPEELCTGENTDIPLLITLNAASRTCPNWCANVMDYRRAYNEFAARERIMVLHLMFHEPEGVLLTGMIVQERAVDLKLSMKRVLLDVSPLLEAGKVFSDIPDLHYCDADGNPREPALERLGNYPVLDVTGLLNTTVSYWITSSDNPHYYHKGFSLERLHSDACGEAAMRGIRLERRFRSDRDSEFLSYWESMGVDYRTHETKGQQWLALAPAAVRSAGCEELPAVCIFQETTKIYPFQNIIGISVWYDYALLAAQGECIVLMFALETPDANDLWIDVLHDAEQLYPIDKSRVYFTGHSHNGMFAAEFVRRFHNEVTAIAPCGNQFGIPDPVKGGELVPVRDEQVEEMSTYDMPTCIISGFGENAYYWSQPGSEREKISLAAFHRRLYAERCPDIPDEKILAAHSSGNRVERILGLPCDRTEVRYLYGRECYIGDYLNKEGKSHFRIIALEDMVHMNSPQMPFLSWDFLRRFRRNPDTGLIEEL